MVGRADYNEWGQITYREALSITSSYRRIWPQSSYTGHDWDDVLGMYYAKARFYSAEDKRFVAVDPIKGNITDPLSLVPYLYCVDNPLRWVDPLGLIQSRASMVNTMVSDAGSGGNRDITLPQGKSTQTPENPSALINPDPQPGPRKDIAMEESSVIKVEEPSTNKIYGSVRNVLASKWGIHLPSDPSEPITFSAFQNSYFVPTPIANYRYNSEIEVARGVINGQGLDPVKDMRYGYTYMEKAGCGLIAIHNALVLLDNPQNLADVILWGDYCAAILGGYFGSNPWAASGLLSEMGYVVESIPVGLWLTFDMEAQKADVCLFTYWNNKNDWGRGMHTVCARYEMNEVKVYNYSNSKNTPEPRKSFTKWIEDENLGPVAFLTVSKQW